MNSRWLCFSCGLILIQPVLAQAQLIILPLGDSITQADASVSRPSYRGPLQTKLNDASIDFDFIGSLSNFCREPSLTPPYVGFDMDHDGHWGWRADEILAGPDGPHCEVLGTIYDGSGMLSTWITGYSELPDIVLLHIGTNDIIQALPDGHAAGVNDLTPAQITQIETRISDIISELKLKILPTKPDMKILLASLIPGTLIDEEVQALNTKIEAIAAADSTVILVDQYAGFNPSTDTYDDIHPNFAGEEHMAQRWFDGIQTATAVPEPSSIVFLALALVTTAVVHRRRQLPSRT